MEKTYKISKTIKHALVAFIEILIAGIIALQADMPELVVILVPALEAIRNILKHKMGVKSL